MQQTDRFVKIGQVLKSNGADGKVIIRLYDTDALEELDFETEPVFIFFDGLPVPFFVDVADDRGGTRVSAHLTGVNSLDDAEEVSGKDLFRAVGEDVSGREDFVGWTLYDSGKVEAVGNIAAIEDIPGNPCLEVRTKAGAALVPFHEDLVVAVNEKEKSLTMRIPEGLL